MDAVDFNYYTSLVLNGPDGAYYRGCGLDTFTYDVLMWTINDMMVEAYESKERCQQRCHLLKEEMVAAVYHPSRVERWLKIGGHELLEAMME